MPAGVTLVEKTLVEKTLAEKTLVEKTLAERAMVVLMGATTWWSWGLDAVGARPIQWVSCRVSLLQKDSLKVARFPQFYPICGGLWATGYNRVHGYRATSSPGRVSDLDEGKTELPFV